jgi:hypothetical protein
MKANGLALGFLAPGRELNMKKRIVPEASSRNWGLAWPGYRESPGRILRRYGQECGKQLRFAEAKKASAEANALFCRNPDRSVGVRSRTSLPTGFAAQIASRK